MSTKLKISTRIKEILPFYLTSKSAEEMIVLAAITDNV